MTGRRAAVVHALLGSSGFHGARAASGRLVIAMDLWIVEEGSADPPIGIEVRQSQGGPFYFVSLWFMSGGWVRLADPDGEVGYLGPVATGRTLPLVIDLNMDLHTYDLRADGQLLRDDEPFTGGVVGVDTIVFSVGPDADLLGRFYVDNLHVTDPDAVPVRRTTWGEIRRLYLP